MAGVNIKMGVDVSQFKQGMQQAQQSAKTFQTQLKANEAQFKATGDKEQYLTEKGKLLKKELEAQKTAVANAQKALDAMSKEVDKNSSEYQKMERALAQAQAAMYDTQAAMNSMTVSEEKANKGASDLTNSLSGIGKKVSFDAVITGIDKITGGLEKAMQKVTSIGQGIWDAMMDAAQLSDDYATQAMILEMDVEDYQKQKKVFDTFAELTVKDWMNAKRKVQAAIYTPTEQQLTALDVLGISTHEMFPGKNGELVRGAAKDWETVFWEIAKALEQKVESGLITQDLADVYATELFGKTFANMKPLIAMGEEGFKAAVDEQSAASKEAIEKNAELNDQLILLKSNLETLKLEILSSLAPALTDAAKALSGVLNSVMEYLKTPEGKEALKQMEDSVSALFEDLSKIDPEDVVNNFVSLFNNLKDAFVWIKKNWTAVKLALGAIVGVLAVGKVTSGAATILQTINGFKTLLGGSSVTIPTQTVNPSAAARNASAATGVGTAGGTTVNAASSVGGTHVSLDGMINPNTGKIIVTDAINAFNEEFAAAHPKFSAAVDFFGTPEGAALLATVTSIPVINALMRDAREREAGEDKYGAGYNDLTYDERLIANGTSVYAVDENTTVADIQRLGAIDKATRKSFLPDILKWTVDAGDWIKTAGDKTIGAIEKAAVGAYQMGDDVFTMLNGALFNDWNNPRSGIVKTGLGLLGPALQKIGGDAWGGIKWFGESMAESFVNIFAHAIPALAHGKDANGDYDQKRTYAQMITEDLIPELSNPVTGKVAEYLLKSMQKDVGGTAEQVAKGFEYSFNTYFKPVWDGIFSKQQETTVKVNMVPGEGTGINHGSWGGAGGGGAGGGLSVSQIFGLMTGGVLFQHANGLFSVPWDGYPALLHKGERVLTAREADRYTYNNYFGNVNLNNGLEIEALTESIERRNRRQRSGYGA